MDYPQCELAMKKHYDYLSTEYSRLQMGRASTVLVEHMIIPTSYGDSPLNQVANISIQDSSTIRIEPRDKSLIKNIIDAIYKNDSGLSPRAGDTSVLVSIPAMTGEKRKQIAKNVSTMAEDVKARLRSTRQDAMNTVKKDFADKTISEDQKKAEEKAIDELTKTMTTKVESLAKAKEEEVLSV